MLPDEAVEEFREIYKKEFGVELSKEETRRRAESLYRLVEAVYGKPRKIKNEENKE